MNRNKGNGNVPNLEIGNDVANALTSFEKDSMVMIFKT